MEIWKPSRDWGKWTAKTPFARFPNKLPLFDLIKKQHYRRDRGKGKPYFIIFSEKEVRQLVEIMAPLYHSPSKVPVDVLQMLLSRSEEMSSSRPFATTVETDLSFSRGDPRQTWHLAIAFNYPIDMR